MKHIITSLLFLSAFVSAFAQQRSKVDDSLLMEYYQSQRYNEAAEYLKKNFPEPVTDLKILARLAYASQMANKLPDAESYYQRAFDLDTTNQNILFNMASINLRRGNTGKAEQYYKRIASLDTGNFAVYRQLGSISEGKNDTVNAVGYFEHANRINPNDVDVASELADYYTTLKHFDKALNVLHKAAENDPENVIILLSTLKLTYGESKWQETIETGNKLIGLGTTSAEILTKMGIAYFHLNNYACGAETFASLKGNEFTEYSFYYMALCYKGLKDEKQAINFMNQAIFQGISTNIATYYGEIADSNEKLNKYKKAATAYQKALQFREAAIVYYLLANLYDTKLKDKKNARLYYKKFLAANPSGKQQAYIAYVKSRVDALKN
jgi:tetratricopeptide (TPR) repeat protein